MASQATGRAQEAAVRWISATRVSLPLSLNLGVGFESGKKGLEQWWDGHNENVEQQEAARVKDANAKKSGPTKSQTKR